MKTVPLVISLLITVILVGEAEGLFFKFRIHKICRKVCNRICHWVIGKGILGKYICRFTCCKICGYSKRKGISDEGSHLTPLPAHLDFYDLNGNGLVEIEEFASTLGHDPKEAGLVEGFRFSDTDNDGKLTLEELTSDSSAFTITDMVPLEKKQMVAV